MRQLLRLCEWSVSNLQEIQIVPCPRFGELGYGHDLVDYPEDVHPRRTDVVSMIVHFNMGEE